MSEQDLWDPSDHAGIRRRIEQGAIDEVTRAFPQTYGSIRLEVDNVRFDGKDRFSISDQKKALLSNRVLARPLKADMRLFDSNTGELLDSREGFTLMRVPYYTDRGTFVHNGSEYTGVTQIRLLPGAYTRRQSNGELETQFNTRIGTGKPLRVGLAAKTGQFRLRAAGSDLHLYSVLRDLGVPDSTLEEAWGRDVLQMNRAKYDSRALSKAYGKLVPKYAQQPDLDRSAMARSLREALLKAQVARRAVDKTLTAYWRDNDDEREPVELKLAMLRKAAGTLTKDVRDQGDKDEEGDEYRPVGVSGLLASTRKLLAVNRQLDVPDNRNSRVFFKFYPVDKLTRERIRLDEGKLRRQMLYRLSMRRSLDAVPPRIFDSYYDDFITANPLTSALEEINPLQLLEQHRRVTQMGPGGINSDDAVTEEMQSVQADEFGFISPIEGPESQRAGVDVRMAWGSKLGPDGRIRQKLLNRRTGQLEYVSPEDLYGKTLKLPD